MGESNQLDLLTLLPLFGRIGGFFLISPLFSGRGIPFFVRFGLSLVCTLLLAPPLSLAISIEWMGPSLLSIILIKEVIIGYLLGLLFALIFEAAALGGQIVGTVTGFSATELLDPLTTQRSPLMAKLFALIVFALFLGFDLHHTLLRLLYESFAALPTTFVPFSREVTIGIMEGTLRLFQLALSFALFPLAIMLCLILIFALLSRQMPIFWTAFPIQMLIGIGTIAFAVTFFGQIVHQAFFECLTVTKRILFGL